MREASPEPDISIILPALTADDQYRRCIHSIRAAFDGKVSYEIITIVSDLCKFHGIADSNLLIILEDGPGIYPAMNVGLNCARGKYIYFIGQDDVLLPAAAGAVHYGKATDGDVIITDVFWGETNIYRNRRPRQWLVWRNWCHQGIIYRRKQFIKVVGQFSVEYKTQADHYANIVLTGNLNTQVLRYSRCIAWYSSSGFSSRSPDVKFRNDFPLIVKKHFGMMSFYMIVIRRALLKYIRLVWHKK